MRGYCGVTDKPPTGFYELDSLSFGDLGGFGAADGSKAKPVEAPADLARILGAVEAEGLLSAALLMLDAGLRIGEVCALGWEHVHFGADGDDEERHLEVCKNLAKGRWLGDPKNGQERGVSLSRRLRRELREEKMRQGNPEAGPVVLRPYSTVQWKFQRVAKNLGLPFGAHRLRHTFCSVLLSQGFPVAYIADQAGHTQEICQRTYAKWIPQGKGGYVQAEPLESGQVPADRIAAWMEREDGLTRKAV